jgi:formylmethanofuran dehydrogenase subunit E
MAERKKEKVRFGGGSTASVTYSVDTGVRVIHPAHGEPYALGDASPCAKCDRWFASGSLVERGGKKLCPECAGSLDHSP